MKYNCYMGREDLSDALIIIVSLKTMRWHQKQFLHSVDTAVVNSFIIHQELAQGKGRTPLTQKKFREISMAEDIAYAFIIADEIEAEELLCTKIDFNGELGTASELSENRNIGVSEWRKAAEE
ncbi:hypothetical protein GJAV_G00014450 [Gymnothorax javanicus]|nr:hypothetical protein GJAV_G00014450 [Gymnothorax javanicus]